MKSSPARICVYVCVCVSVCLVSQLCLTLGDPWTAAHQAPLSMEFSRQEYWSGLPFPSPRIFLTQGPNPGLLHCRRIIYQLSCKGSPRILEWVAVSFSRGPSQPRSRTLEVNSLRAKPPGKPKNPGMGSLSLLQRIIPTKESNWGLLHCKQILYQLSYGNSAI